MIHFKDYYSYGLFAFIALLSWWLVKLNVLELFTSKSTIGHSRDYFSNHYAKWDMSEVGTLKTKLTADSMTHYQDDGTIHLAKPVMAFFNEETPPWVISSETGKISADGKNVWLNGKAIVSRAQAEGSSPLTINTSNLKVKPETSYAQTADWAELVSLKNRTTGIGMKLTYAQPIHIELLANVKGHYETKKK